MIFHESLVLALALAAPFQPGDVFVGISDGTYARYSESGVFQEVLDTGYGGNVAGCAFDRAGDLYGTHFDFDRLIRFSALPPHTIRFDVSDDGPPATGSDTECESIVFDAAGTFLVGRGDGTPGAEVHRYDATGGLLYEYQVPGDARGSDWLDLASDQCTLYYTSEGRRILRYDVCADRPLADFATLPPTPGKLFAFRLLPPGDGSGGLIVADRGDIKRLDAAGGVVQTYDAPGEDRWFALNLAPDEASFWSADVATANLYRFDLATGAVLLGPLAVGPPGQSAVNGVCVYGEPTAAVCAMVPPPVSGLKGVRRVRDADFVWQQASDPATDHYHVWKVITGDKTLIPRANADEAANNPAIRPVCLLVPPLAPACTDPDAVAPPPLLFYQVRGACHNDVEGTE